MPASVGVAENEPLRPKGRMNKSTENLSPEVVGELRRVIHELKNALTPILANAQLARSVLGPDSEVAGELEDVVAGAQRANKLLGEIRMIAEGLGGHTP
jgi:signal transduction histidine kinase